MKIGVLSDTHGLLRPEVLPALAHSEVEQILHLGDVGDAAILKTLAAIAPVHAIRGNIDRSGLCGKLPETDVLLFAGHTLYLLHDLGTLDLDPAAARFSVVLYGHSHKPHSEVRKDVLYFNPGSCGPRRFELPITLGILTLEAGRAPAAEIVSLPSSP
ncbi:MAG TPA: metallophosphoesterase family protein [Terracidiphilus sp.]|nr:metallophosphoesterase family protein [Terracidiphilus sp.]